MLLSVDSINKIYNGEFLLKNISLTVEDHEIIGLIGINGCGKSTLLKIITGEEEFDKTPDGRGFVSVGNNVNIGFLKQNTGLDNDNTVDDEMHKPFSKLIEVLEKMKGLEKKMSESEGYELEKITHEYSELSSYFESRDGYTIDVKIKTILNGMGFEDLDLKRQISSLSGGEKTRLALSKLLLENPEILILDEPTNHLDFKTLMWLEDYLKGYKGSIIIVSHDRYFLNRLCTRICEIENGSLVSYKGNYDAYLNLKKMANERQLKEYEAQQQRIANLQDFIDRNRVSATSATQAKSRQHMLDRILDNAVEKPLLYQKSAKIKFEYDIIPPKEVLNVTNVDLAVGEGENRKVLIDDLSFNVRRGEKVALIGSNGIGKTSILKLIQGIIPHKKGHVEWAANVKTAYFEQEHTILDKNNTVIDEIHKKYPRMTDLEVRNILGNVLITGEDVFKYVSVLSGGEKAKLCFALMMLRRGNVLILDEPTNHLDLATKEVLEQALCDYDGTIIFVSHDRYFLNKVASRIIEVTEEKIETFNGNFDFYAEIMKVRQEDREKLILEEKQRKQHALDNENKQKQYKTREQRAADARRRQRINELEGEIEALEVEIFNLEEEIATPEVSCNFVLMHEKCTLLENKKNELNEKLDEWASLE